MNTAGPTAQGAGRGTAATAAGPVADGQPALPGAAAGDAAVSPHPGGPRGPRRRGRGWLRRRLPQVQADPQPGASRPPLPAGTVLTPGIDLAADDPLARYLAAAAGPVDIRGLDLDSRALRALKETGAVLVVPLIWAGAPIGVLSLGPRLSERDYTTDDRRLLAALAGHAAPAIRVGQLVRDQQARARRQERIDQQLKVAQLIQQQFLPQSQPELPGWQIAAFYRPALTVGGDFYDFIPLPGGRVMVVVGDVTGKGVPAALVMASAHALLRAAAPRLTSPGAVLAHVNDLLYTDTPAQMFVTCLALVLPPAGGEVTFANAGHDLPYVRTAGGVTELRAKGMPLGLMPGSAYQERTFAFRPGDCALLHSDGLSEAHSASQEMFGFHRVAALAGSGPAARH